MLITGQMLLLLLLPLFFAPSVLPVADGHHKLLLTMRSGDQQFELSPNSTLPILLKNAEQQNGAVIQPLNAFLEQFFVGKNSVEVSEWERALPTDVERIEMHKLIHFLLTLDNFSPLSENPAFLAGFAPVLSKSVSLTFIGDTYCLIHERPPLLNSFPLRFARFWGYAVISARPIMSNLHHSAAHFQSDGDVCNQAAAIFEQTQSKSLVVAGANRFAVRGKAESPCQSGTAMADAAHNNQTMFHTICEALWVGGGRKGTFLQWHGMAETTCPGTGAFLSVGANGTHPLYARKSAAVNRIASAINAMVGKHVAKTPANDGTCRLVAMTNPFGRLINGVPAKNVCKRSAKANVPRRVRGQFIHIEQTQALRDEWTLWTKALKEAFPVPQRG